MKYKIGIFSAIHQDSSSSNYEFLGGPEFEIESSSDSDKMNMIDLIRLYNDTLGDYRLSKNDIPIPFIDEFKIYSDYSIIFDNSELSILFTIVIDDELEINFFRSH